VVVDGFEVDGNNSLQQDGAANICFNTYDAYNGKGNSATQAGSASHHIWILNNIIHHCNQSGVSLGSKEWYYVLHNTVYHNSFLSGYNGSGISYFVIQCIEAGGTNCYTSGIVGVPPSGYSYVPSGNDLSPDQPVGYYPFHNVVAWNVAYNNRVTNASGLVCNTGGGSAHTDGNGIIMDTFYDGFSITLKYQYQTLVMNNVAYYNGGRGVHTVAGHNITFANNTAYNNNTDTCEQQYQWGTGELYRQNTTNVTFINNLGKAVEGLGWKGSAPTGPNACALATTGSTGDTGNSYNNNILSTPESIDAVAPLVHACLDPNDANVFSCSNNQCHTDPGYVNATPGALGNADGTAPTGGWVPGNNANFALQSTSPAINYSQTPLPPWMPSQNTDAGACHHSLITCPNPGTSNY